MKPAVFRPAARSRMRWSIGRRTKAWVPVMKARPDCRVYLSSRLACRTRSGAFMSLGILPALLGGTGPGRQPVAESFAHLCRALERGQVPAVFYDPQGRAPDSAGYFLVAIQGRDAVLTAAEHQGRAGDSRQQRQAVGPVHDRLLLADESVLPSVFGHFLDSGH